MGQIRLSSIEFDLKFNRIRPNLTILAKFRSSTIKLIALRSIKMDFLVKNIVIMTIKAFIKTRLVEFGLI